MGDLTNIEKAITAANVLVERAETLKKLRDNKDFKKIFLEYYGRELAVSLVRSKALSSLQDVGSQKYIDEQINAIGHLFQFMDIILAQGVTAVDTIIAHTEERDILLQEEVIND